MFLKPILSILSIIPLAGFYTNIFVQEHPKIPQALVAQGWLLTALAAGLTFTRIALWLRGDKTSKGNGNANGRYEERLQIANLDKVLSKISTVLDNLVRNQESLNSTGNRAMESHAKLAMSQQALLDAIDRQTAAITELTNEFKDNRHS